MECTVLVEVVGIDKDPRPLTVASKTEEAIRTAISDATGIPGDHQILYDCDRDPLRKNDVATCGVISVLDDRIPGPWEKTPIVLEAEAALAALEKEAALLEAGLPNWDNYLAATRRFDAALERGAQGKEVLTTSSDGTENGAK